MIGIDDTDGRRENFGCMGTKTCLVISLQRLRAHEIPMITPGPLDILFAVPYENKSIRHQPKNFFILFRY